MRLIDADDYKHRLECAFYGSERDGKERNIIKFMIMTLDMQETAYDIENVVKKLEEKKEQYVLKSEKWKNKGDETENKLMNIAMMNMASCYKDEIKIVKECEWNGRSI